MRKAKDSDATLVHRKETSLYGEDRFNNSRPLLEDAEDDAEHERHQFN